MVGARQFEIVILRTRAAAQRLEVEPDHTTALAQGGNDASEHLDAASGDALAAGDGGEITGHFRFGTDMEDFELFERAQPVIAPRIDFQHIDLRLDQRNRLQEALALQAVRIELVRRIIRSHHEDHAAREQCVEQTAKNHRVGDVGKLKLVEADQAVLAGDSLGDFRQRVVLTLEGLELRMNVLHKGMKVYAALAYIRHRIVEAVHQKALAATDAAPEVDAARQFWRRKHSAQGAAPTDLERQQLVVELLQPQRSIDRVAAR